MRTEEYLSELNKVVVKLNLIRDYLYANDLENAYKQAVFGGYELYKFSKQIKKDLGMDKK